MRNVPTTTVHQWERPSGPWQRVHLDFLGPVDDKMFLIALCAYSKWPEVVVMNKGTTAKQIVKALRSMFATCDFPSQMHSDNAVQFLSHEFQQFMRSNGIRHTMSAIYHPNSNGPAEHFVAIFKCALKTMQSDKTSMDTKIACFLITYHTSVNSSTGEIPSVLMTGKRLRTRLDLVEPTEQNYKPKPNHSERQFYIGQAVAVREYRACRTNKWIPGIISDKHGHLMYSVRISSPDGSVTFKRHVDQILPRQNADVDLNTSDMDQDIPTATFTMNQGPSNQPPPPLPAAE